MTDLQTRVRRGLREYADAPPVPARPFVPPSSPRMRWQWPWAVLAATAVAVLLAGVVALPGILRREGGKRPEPTTGGQASLPRQFAGFSPLTATVSAAPPGRAIAVYVQGRTGPRGLGRQALVLGARGDVYRRVDVAEQRGGDVDDGEWMPAPMLLAPRGDVIAVGAVGPVADVAVVDLSTGETRHHPLPTRGYLHLLAMSPNARHLAYFVAPGPGANDGPLLVLDLETGQSRQFSKSDERGSRAVFDPDSSLVAFRVGDRLRVYTVADGLEERELMAEDDPVSPLVWSPDGSEIAYYGDFVVRERSYRRLSCVDALRRERSCSRDSRDEADLRLLAWRNADTLLLAGEDGLYEVPVNGGERRLLSRFGDGGTEMYPIIQPQVATALLPDVVGRPTGDADRGPWPAWFGITVLAGAAVVVALVKRPIMRRWSRLRKRRSAPPRGNHS